MGLEEFKGISTVCNYAQQNIVKQIQTSKHSAQLVNTDKRAHMYEELINKLTFSLADLQSAD